MADLFTGRIDTSPISWTWPSGITRRIRLAPSTTLNTHAEAGKVAPVMRVVPVVWLPYTVFSVSGFTSISFSWYVSLWEVCTSRTMSDPCHAVMSVVSLSMDCVMPSSPT